MERRFYALEQRVSSKTKYIDQENSAKNTKSFLRKIAVKTGIRAWTCQGSKKHREQTKAGELERNRLKSFESKLYFSSKVFIGEIGSLNVFC